MTQTYAFLDSPGRLVALVACGLALELHRQPSGRLVACWIGARGRAWAVVGSV